MCLFPIKFMYFFFPPKLLVCLPHLCAYYNSVLSTNTLPTCPVRAGFAFPSATSNTATTGGLFGQQPQANTSFGAAPTAGLFGQLATPQQVKFLHYEQCLCRGHSLWVFGSLDNECSHSRTFPGTHWNSSLSLWISEALNAWKWVNLTKCSSRGLKAGVSPTLIYLHFIRCLL